MSVNLPMAIPRCHGRPMVLVKPATREQAFCGASYACSPGPRGDSCSSSVLFPSPGLIAQLREMARTPEEHAHIDLMAGESR